ncbi:disulfide bond formation protein DsbA [Croceicoccus estronivorus]|nr:disulfide bond formation protein DsbA [Croceicoccus estronivorus]
MGFSRIVLFALCAVLLGFGGGFAASWTGLTKPVTEAVVHDYLLNHPEVIPEAMDRLQARDAANRLKPIRAQVMTPFPGAVLGNPNGSKVLVEFSDFACTYCRQSVEEVDALIASDPQLKVVIRELPILSEQSAAAAQMGLAAAEQGQYAAFHKAMYELGPPSPASIEAAAKKAGLDMERARKVADSQAVKTEIARNLAIADRLGFNGTPSWVAGEQAFSGAVPRNVLADALAQGAKAQE